MHLLRVCQWHLTQVYVLHGYCSLLILCLLAKTDDLRRSVMPGSGVEHHTESCYCFPRDFVLLFVVFKQYIGAFCLRWVYVSLLLHC